MFTTEPHKASHTHTHRATTTHRFNISLYHLTSILVCIIKDTLIYRYTNKCNNMPTKAVKKKTAIKHINKSELKIFKKKSALVQFYVKGKGLDMFVRPHGYKRFW